MYERGNQVEERKKTKKRKSRTSSFFCPFAQLDFALFIIYENYFKIKGRKKERTTHVLIETPRFLESSSSSRGTSLR